MDLDKDILVVVNIMVMFGLYHQMVVCKVLMVILPMVHLLMGWLIVVFPPLHQELQHLIVVIVLFQQQALMPYLKKQQVGLYSNLKRLNNIVYKINLINK